MQWKLELLQSRLLAHGCFQRGVPTELWCGRRKVRVTGVVFFFFLSTSGSFSLAEKDMVALLRFCWWWWHYCICIVLATWTKVEDGAGSGLFRCWMRGGLQWWYCWFEYARLQLLLRNNGNENGSRAVVAAVIGAGAAGEIHGWRWSGGGNMVKMESRVAGCVEMKWWHGNMLLA